MRKLNKHRMATLLILVMLVCALPVVSYASSYQDDLEAAEQEKDRLEKEQKENEKELNQLEKEEKNLQKQLEELNQQLTEVSDKLANLEYQISEKELEIEYIVTALADAKNTESQQYESMKLRLQYMYEFNAGSYLDFLFGADDFSDFLNFLDFYEQMASYDKEMLEELEAQREYIETVETQLNQEKAGLDNLKVEAEAEKTKVNGLIGQMTVALAEHADEIAAAEKAVEEYEKKLKEAEKDIKYLEQKIKEEMILSQIAASSTWRDISQVKFAEGDRYLLANLIYCEAGGEPYEGQVAVGAVVINRVLSSKYPDTVVGVIYQKSQFSPAGSGRLAIALAQNKATESCYRAADEAMAGVTNVGNCLYFRTPIPGLVGLQIGGHIFY